MKRDDEIKRLVNYAKGLGCTIKIDKVKNRKGQHKTLAEFDIENDAIYVYPSPNTSKVSIVLDLVHELAHYKSFIARKRKISKAEAYRYDKLAEPKVPPYYIRKQIYKDEEKDLRYWDEIVKDCKIEIKKERIEFQKDVDLLWYELFVLFGYDFTRKEYLEYYKLIKRKYQ